MIVVWILAVIGVIFIGLTCRAFLVDPEPPAPHMVRISDEEVRAEIERQDHQQLVAHYRDFIDELYDFGEHIASDRKDLP